MHTKEILECVIVLVKVSLFLFLLLQLVVASPPEVTNYELLRMSPQDFFAHPRAYETIDLQDPKHHLLSVSIFQATNLLRENKDLPPFMPDNALHMAGEDHIQSMIQYDFFNHFNPILPEQYSPQLRIESRGGDFRMIAENIARVHPFKIDNKIYFYQEKGGQFRYYDENKSPLQVMTYGELGKAIVTDWYRSKGHRNNLLSKEYTHLGTAIFIEPSAYQHATLPDVYAVQNFGKK